MAYTSWGQRRALGRRYGQDPALLMEMERLQREYDLAPSREARRLQEEQFNKGLAQQQSQYEQNREDAKAAGITGTIANLGTSAAMLRGLTKGKDEPFFGQTASNLWDKAWGNAPQTATPGMTPAVAGYTQTAPAYAQFMPSPGGYEGVFGSTPLTVNPALTDTAATGLAAGAEAGTGAGAATASAAPSAWATYGVPGMQAVAAYEGSRLLGNQFKEDTFVNRALRDPLTGIAGEGLRAVGLRGAADQLNRWEKDLIQKPLDVVTDAVSDFIDDITPW